MNVGLVSLSKRISIVYQKITIIHRQKKQEGSYAKFVSHLEQTIHQIDNIIHDNELDNYMQYFDKPETKKDMQKLKRTLQFKMERSKQFLN